MSVSELFSHWRKIKHPKQSWGLAWFLAYEFCKRYYSSHGIAPFINEHEGLGYYGILIESIPCKINNTVKTYGRLTASGNVENWSRGISGDHGLNTIAMCVNKDSTEEIVQKAIAHIGIEPIPQISHYNCRHKRWGRSYELCFEIAAIVALRNESTRLKIWNHPYHTKRMISDLDPNSDMKEHLGAFLFVGNGRELLLAGDGRLLDDSGQNVWHSFMNGYSSTYLAELVEERIGMTK